MAGVTQVGQDTVHLDTVEYAKVADDCQIGEWTLANYHIRGGRSSPQAVVVGNYVIVVGGWGDLDLIDVFSDVQVGTARDDGSLAPWRVFPTALPTGIYGHATTLVELDGSHAYLLMSVGGQPGTGAYANWISFCYIRSGATVPDAMGIWRIAPSGQLKIGLAGHAVVYARGRLYIVGGNGPDGQSLRDVLMARFDPGRPR